MTPTLLETAAVPSFDDASALPVLRSRLLSDVPGVVHGLTGRVVGLGVADGNVGLGTPRDRDDAWRMRGLWCTAIGVDAEALVTVHQVHGTEVAVATRDSATSRDASRFRPLGNADAIVTAETDLPLMTLHADCLPILLCDPGVPVIAAVHAGWRGTVAGVAQQAVAVMVDEFGARVERTIAYLGPANLGCCYEVGEDVVAGWLTYDAGDTARALKRAGERWHFDIGVANRWILMREGLRASNIEMSAVCTRCDAGHWFSHRGQGPLTGRFGAIIELSAGRG